DQGTEEVLIVEAYQRSKEAVSCSHLLLLVDPDASPEDTLKAYNTAHLYLDSILNGRDFAEMAKLHSMDPSAYENLGYLGYFSVFDMVYPFETAAYATPIDEISIVRTSYGYHLIKVHNKVKSEGKKKMAHIIVRVGPQYSAMDEESAVLKIEEIYQKLKDGVDFTKLAEEFSDDPTNSNRGGDLGSGRLLPIMEGVKRGLPAGKFSVPFKTSFGWHIMKTTSMDSLESFEEAKPELVSKISKDTRSHRGRENLIENVKKGNRFKLYPEVIEKFNALIKDVDVYKKGRWRYPERLEYSFKNSVLFEIGTEDWHLSRSLMDYYNFYFRYRKEANANTISSITEEYMEEFIEEEVIAFQESHLTDLYPEYAYQIKEYRHGIMLFTLTEDYVWRKAVEDTAGLRDYFDRHRENFKANNRVIVREFHASNPELLEDVKRMISEGKTDKQIDSLTNSFSATNLRIRVMTYEEWKTLEEIDLFEMPIGTQSPISKGEKGFVLRVVQETIPAQLSNFDEAKSETVAGYQTYLEEWWLIELETKYPVAINEEVLQTLFQ
ncbi:MAG: peptidyl-prolyl cis-trans isomerase SurA, partial [Crocinitomicaceae bacterium]